MSRFEKLLARLYTYPKDFTWDELMTLLKGLGYEELKKGKTGGSRRKFYDKTNNLLINLHEPHPQNILKEYMVRDVVEHLTQRGKKIEETTNLKSKKATTK